MSRKTAYGASSLDEDNRYRANYRAVGRALMRCSRLVKTLQEDGNSFQCEGCKRIVGFMRLPQTTKPPKAEA